MSLEIKSPMIALCVFYEMKKVGLEDKHALQEIINIAKKSVDSGAVGFCLMSDETYLSPETKELIAHIAKAFKTQNLKLHLIASGGIAGVEDLGYLKAHGLYSYHHSLFSSKVFFEALQKQMPLQEQKGQWHKTQWKEHFATCENAYNAELGLCSSGCFGLGEGWGERIELLKMLQILSPHSVILHFSTLGFGTMQKDMTFQNLDFDERLECITIASEFLAKTRLMMRLDSKAIEPHTQESIHQLYQAGISTFITSHTQIDKLVAFLSKEGYRLAQSCH